jgi:hypothetical protein
MLSTVILGIAAGFLTPYAEPHLKKALENVMLADVPISALELRTFSFALCLVAAAILAWLFGNGSGLALAIGGALGAFAPRALERFQNRNSDVDE